MLWGGEASVRSKGASRWSDDPDLVEGARNSGLLGIPLRVVPEKRGGGQGYAAPAIGKARSAREMLGQGQVKEGGDRLAIEEELAIANPRCQEIESGLVVDAAVDVDAAVLRVCTARSLGEVAA